MTRLISGKSSVSSDETFHQTLSLLGTRFPGSHRFTSPDLREENVSKAFMVEIAQREFVEEDPLNDCRDYPNADYISYDECDNKFMREAC